MQPSNAKDESTEFTPERKSLDTGNAGSKKDSWDIIQILLTAVTAVLVLWVNTRTADVESLLKNSQANAQLVATLVPDLSDRNKSDLALITLYYHFQESGSGQEKHMVDDLASSVVRSGLQNNTVPKNVSLNSFALGIIKRDEPEKYLQFLDLLSDAQPHPRATTNPKSRVPGQVLPSNKQKSEALAIRQILDANATVYVEYSVHDVNDPQKRAELQSRAEKVAADLRSRRSLDKPLYSVAEVGPTDLYLRQTSVRYYYAGDQQLAEQLSNDVQSSLGFRIGFPHYNGPADVPHGQLEVWIATGNAS